MRSNFKISIAQLTALLFLTIGFVWAQNDSNAEDLKKGEIVNQFLIPAGFVGWLCIEYLDDSAPKFGIKNNIRTITVTKSGVIRTRLDFRKVNRELLYFSGEKRWPIPTEHLGGYFTSGHYDKGLEKYTSFGARQWIGIVHSPDSRDYSFQKVGCGMPNLSSKDSN